MSKVDRLAPPRFARMVTLIQVTYSIGSGNKDDPVRLAQSYYTESGELVAEYDSYLDDPGKIYVPRGIHIQTVHSDGGDYGTRAIGHIE
jgi:hypothetical protein